MLCMQLVLNKYLITDNWSTSYIVSKFGKYGCLPFPSLSPSDIHEINTYYVHRKYGKPSLWSSVQFSRSVVFDSLRPHESQHARPPCPSPTPGVHSDSSSQWCPPAISSSVVPFSSCPQSLPASESFPTLCPPRVIMYIIVQAERNFWSRRANDSCPHGLGIKLHRLHVLSLITTPSTQVAIYSFYLSCSSHAQKTSHVVT